MSFVIITDKAKEKINQLCKENNVYAITLNLKGGGCAGYQYDWGVTDAPTRYDEIISTGDGNLAIGKKSMLFLMGTEIDYVTSIVGSNFDIQNPNAKSSCGCGTSVSFDVSTLPKKEKPVFTPTW
jgi:iron-sulfur cluster assembly accessory protein